MDDVEQCGAGVRLVESGQSHCRESGIATGCVVCSSKLALNRRCGRCEMRRCTGGELKEIGSDCLVGNDWRQVRIAEGC